MSYDDRYSSPGWMNGRERDYSKLEGNGGCLCMFLGGFGPLGIIVAAIIGGRDGVVDALIGWFVSWIFVVVGIVAWVRYNEPIMKFIVGHFG